MNETRSRPTRETAEGTGEQPTDYEIADVCFWRHDRGIMMTEAEKPPAPATQGEAVRKALKGDRSIDIDRWQDFSRAEAAEQAQDPAAPLDPAAPVKPRAWLARDGGTVSDTVPPLPER